MEQLIKTAEEAPMLTLEEEVSAWNDPKKWSKIVESHLRLCIAVAKELNISVEDFKEAVLEGVQGLYDALENSVPMGNVRFSAIARIYIRGRIVRFLVKKGSMTKFPPGSEQKRYWYLRAIMGNDSSEEDIEHICDVTGLPRDAIEEAIQYLGMDSPISDIVGMACEESTPEQDAVDSDLLSKAKDGIEALPYPKQAQAMTLYYIEGKTGAEVADIMGVSRRRVYYLINAGVENIKRTAL